MKQRRRGGRGVESAKKSKTICPTAYKIFLGTEVFNSKKKEAEKVIKRKESKGGRAGAVR